MHAQPVRTRMLSRLVVDVDESSDERGLKRDDSLIGLGGVVALFLAAAVVVVLLLSGRICISPVPVPAPVAAAIAGSGG